MHFFHEKYVFTSVSDWITKSWYIYLYFYESDPICLFWYILMRKMLTNVITSSVLIPFINIFLYKVNPNSIRREGGGQFTPCLSKSLITQKSARRYYPWMTLSNSIEITIGYRRYYTWSGIKKWAIFGIIIGVNCPSPKKTIYL